MMHFSKCLTIKGGPGKFHARIILTCVVLSLLIVTDVKIFVRNSTPFITSEVKESGKIQIEMLPEKIS